MYLFAFYFQVIHNVFIILKDGVLMRRYMSLLIVAIMLVIITACRSNDNNIESEKVEKEDQEESDEKANENDEIDSEEVDSNDTGSDYIYFKDNVAKIRDVQVEITDVKVMEEDTEGHEFMDGPVMAFWYEATNFTDDDIDPMTAWFAIFTAIQDNDPNAVNELNVDSLPDMDHLDSQTQTIKKDGTVESSIGYTLDDLETPVTLIATQGLGGDEIGKKNFEIE